MQLHKSKGTTGTKIVLKWLSIRQLLVYRVDLFTQKMANWKTQSCNFSYSRKEKPDNGKLKTRNWNNNQLAGVYQGSRTGKIDHLWGFAQLVWPSKGKVSYTNFQFKSFACLLVKASCPPYKTLNKMKPQPASFKPKLIDLSLFHFSAYEQKYQSVDTDVDSPTVHYFSKCREVLHGLCSPENIHCLSQKELEFPGVGWVLY